MAIKILKRSISISLSLLAIFLYKKFNSDRHKKVVIAMSVCSIADMFMVDFFNLGMFSQYIGAVIFMCGHIIYGINCVIAIKKKQNNYINKGFIFGLSLIILCTISLAIITFVINKSNQLVMYLLILIYLCVIGYNLVSQFSLAYIEKGKRYLLMIGMLLFIISDYVIFLNMLGIIPEHNLFVWTTYIPAQLLIIYFI